MRVKGGFCHLYFLQNVCGLSRATAVTRHESLWRTQREHSLSKAVVKQDEAQPPLGPIHARLCGPTGGSFTGVQTLYRLCTPLKSY